MYRKPIYENNERYSEAVKKVIELKEQGLKEEEIPKNLSSVFQEKEIIGLINDLRRLPTLTGNIKLKSVLKISLWTLLFIKIYTIPIIVATIEIPTYWKLLIFFISLIIVGLTLYYTYKEMYEYVFLILMVLFILSTDSFVDNIQNLFTLSILSISWWIGLLINSAFIMSLFSSWKLKKIYLRRLLRLKELVKKEKLNFI